MKYLKQGMEALCLISFLISYQLYGLVAATATLLCMTLFSVAVVFVAHKRLPLGLLFSALLVGVFGGITIISGDTQFIKMKPTIFYSLCGALLIGGRAFNKGLMFYILREAFDLSHAQWKRLSLHWGVFFLLCAVLNELIRHNFSELFWVRFKVFGFTSLAICFFIGQMILWRKYLKIRHQD